MRIVRLSPILASLSFGSVFGCSDSRPLPTALSPVESGRASVPTVDLATEIDNLLRSGYAGGTRQAISSRWSNIVRQNEREPNGQLSNGRTGPAAAARKQLTQLVAFLESKTDESTPSTGETRTHFVTRLVLDMSLYIYAGPATPVPVLTATSDVVLKVVVPTQTDTVATPALQAAVIFPAGAVAEPTIVVVSPVSTYYPANCSGPLDTGLCQYPNFYHFNVFPDVKLAVPAQVQVCHVDAGTNRLPLADHSRFRVAHEKPANPADYSAGGTIVDNVEVLALVPLMNVTNCEGGNGTTYTPAVSASASHTPFGQMRDVAARLVHRTLAAAARAVTPRNAYAIDVGGGGFVESFSVFGIVDPFGKADIAQSTTAGTRFRILETEGFAGDTIIIPSWTIRNAGSATSGSVSGVISLATEALMTSPISSIPVATIAALVPGETHAYAPTQFILPYTLAPGTYYLGTIASHTRPDSTASDDAVSIQLTVLNPSPTYTMTDLGGLGSRGADVKGINESGVIVGQSANAASTPRGFVWQAGVMTDIGSLAGHATDEVAATGINDLGEIVGNARNAAGQRRAFIKTTAGFLDLGGVPGFISTFANAINNSGDVVGATNNVAPLVEGNPNTIHAVRWAARGAAVDLGLLGGAWNSQIFAVNQRGQYAVTRDVGYVVTTNVLFNAAEPPMLLKDLDNPSTVGGGAIAQAINDSGVVAGLSKALSGSATHAYIYRPGAAAAIDLGTLGGPVSTAFGINNQGIVVGGAMKATGPQFPFVWNRRAGMIALPVLAGATRGFARVINESGVIAGNVFVPTNVGGVTVIVTHGVRWTPAP